MILAVMGLPGSGKSYFATRLAKRIGAHYLSSDMIRRLLLAFTTYTLEEKMRVYNIMIREMQASVSQHESVVLDATFYKAEIREMFIRAAKEMGQEIAFIEIRADESLTKERLKKKRLNSEADFLVYLKLKEDFEPLEEPHLILHSKQNNIVQMITDTEKYLQNIYEP